MAPRGETRGEVNFSGDARERGKCFDCLQYLSHDVTSLRKHALLGDDVVQSKTFSGGSKTNGGGGGEYLKGAIMKERLCQLFNKSFALCQVFCLLLL